MPRHNHFTNEEWRDMTCIYAQENFRGSSAARRYELLYPDRRQPNHKTFANRFHRLGETRSFHNMVVRNKSHLIKRMKFWFEYMKILQ